MIGKDQHDGEITTSKDKDGMLMVDSSSPDQMSIELVPHDEVEIDLGMDSICKEDDSIMDGFLDKVVNDNLSCLEVDNVDLGMDFISKKCDVRADLEVIENNNNKLTCLDKGDVLEDVFMTKDDMSSSLECTSTDLVEESVNDKRECNIFLDEVVEDLFPIHNNDLDIETFDTNIEITQTLQTCQKKFDECLDKVCANHDRKLEVMKNNNKNTYIHETGLLLQQFFCDMFQVEGVQGSEKYKKETNSEVEVLHQDQQHEIEKSLFDFTHSNELSREISYSSITHNLGNEIANAYDFVYGIDVIHHEEEFQTLQGKYSMQPTSVEEMERTMNLMSKLIIEMSSRSCSHNMLDFQSCDSCRIHPLESHSKVR